MNNDLDSRISELESAVAELTKIANAYKIDKQDYIRRGNQQLKASLGTKVAYNSSGLITGSQPLEASDIPPLPIGKISDLSSILDGKAPASSIDDLASQISNIRKKGKTVATGSVVNVDENGLVTSVSPLLPTNVPELPIDKITGLSETLQQLRSTPNNDSFPSFHSNSITPGIASKVEYDENGHITGSQPLEESDILSLPTHFGDLESKISGLEKAIHQLTTSFSSISNEVNKKVFNGISGEYTKLTLDENGNIKSSGKLTPDDIPVIPMSKVDGLHQLIATLATEKEFTRLSESTNNEINTINQNIEAIGESLEYKASLNDLSALQSEFKSLSNNVSNLAKAVPSDQLEVELQNISTELSKLSGRISAVEQNLHINE